MPAHGTSEPQGSTCVTVTTLLLLLSVYCFTLLTGAVADGDTTLCPNLANTPGPECVFLSTKGDKWDL